MEGNKPNDAEILLTGLINHFAGGQVAAQLSPETLQALRADLSRQQGQHFAEDMSRLWDMLGVVVTRSGRDPSGQCAEGNRGGPSADSESDLDLLNLACGRCEEGTVLSAFFGRGHRPVRQFAMDLREREIGSAKRRYEATEKLFEAHGVPRIRSSDGRRSSAEFVADDATHLLGYGQVPNRFDVVFIRHQNLWFDGPVWRRIYEFALNSIADDGLLIITSYFDREHLLALELLRGLGGRILATESNPNSRPLDYPGKSVDRHVAAIGRPRKDEVDPGIVLRKESNSPKKFLSP